MLGELVPISVISDLVNKYVSKEANRPVLFTRPPRVVLVQLRCSVFIINDLMSLGILSNSLSLFEGSIETWLMSHFEG